MCSKRRADSVIDEEKDCGFEEDSSGTVDDCRLPPCVSAGRYFDALQGPELEIPKVSTAFFRFSVACANGTFREFLLKLLLSDLCGRIA
jgi:hypothetical protein